MLHGKKVNLNFTSPVCPLPLSADKNLLVIGKDGDILWKDQIHSDVKRFDELSALDSVIIGRKTWELTLKSRPLANRENIVLTNNRRFTISNKMIIVAHSIEWAIRNSTSDTVWINGGAEMYALALRLGVVDEIHWTMIYERFPGGGDAFFPDPPEFRIENWERSSFEFFKPGEGEAKRDKFATAYNVLRRRTASCS